MNEQQKATRNSWMRKPLPEIYVPLHFDRAFIVDEYEQLSYGFIPDCMDDHWFIYLDPEENVIYFHRSWTGFCIYKVRFERSGTAYRVAEAFVNRDPDQYSGTDDDYDAALICFLIDKLLLGKETPFPLPSNERNSRRTHLTWSTR